MLSIICTEIDYVLRRHSLGTCHTQVKESHVTISDRDVSVMDEVRLLSFLVNSFVTYIDKNIPEDAVIVNQTEPLTLNFQVGRFASVRCEHNYRSQKTTYTLKILLT
jgi:hypothetical protein